MLLSSGKLVIIVVTPVIPAPPYSNQFSSTFNCKQLLSKWLFCLTSDGQKENLQGHSLILMARTERDQTQREIGAYRGVPVLHFPLVVVWPAQSAAPVELDVELVGVGPSPVDVHTVVVVGVAWEQTSYTDSVRQIPEKSLISGSSSVFSVKDHESGSDPEVSHHCSQRILIKWRCDCFYWQ